MRRATTEHVILYYRSTKGKPASKQKPVAQSFVDRNKLIVVGTFTERANARGFPALQEAIEACRQEDALLVISNLGKLSRSPEFIELLRFDVRFVAIEDPNFNDKTIRILGAVAKEECGKVSRKTKDALANLKANGVKLGSARPGHWQGREALRGNLTGSKKAAKLRRQRTKDYYAFVTPRILAWREEGLSYLKIAERLNKEGLTTQTGKPYTDVAVLRICQRRQKCNS
jgi:DNA invertase Pin-like site-specific DNA recombinase